MNMTTQRTPYAAAIRKADENGASPDIIAELEAKAEGYRQCQADYAPLLEAAEAALVAWETDPTTFSDDDLEAHYLALAATVSNLRAAVADARRTT